MSRIKMSMLCDHNSCCRRRNNNDKHQQEQQQQRRYRKRNQPQEEKNPLLWRFHGSLLNFLLCFLTTTTRLGYFLPTLQVTAATIVGSTSSRTKLVVEDVHHYHHHHHHERNRNTDNDFEETIDKEWGRGQRNRRLTNQLQTNRRIDYDDKYEPGKNTFDDDEDYYEDIEYGQVAPLVWVTMYVALPVNSKSQGFLVCEMLTSYLNQTSLLNFDANFYQELPESYNGNIYQLGPPTLRRRRRQQRERRRQQQQQQQQQQKRQGQQRGNVEDENRVLQFDFEIPPIVSNSTNSSSSTETTTPTTSSTSAPTIITPTIPSATIAPTIISSNNGDYVENATGSLNLFYLDQKSNIYLKNDNAWWWQYNMSYIVTYPNLRSLTDPAKLQYIKDDIYSVLLDATTSEEFDNWVNNSYYSTGAMDSISLTPILDFEMDPNIINLHSQTGELTGPFLDEGDEFGAIMPLPPNTTFPPNTTLQPITTLPPTPGPLTQSIPDPNLWTWQRYVGLGFFIFTVLFTCTLMSLASCQKRRLRQKEEWGYLATREGLDEVLQTGWKIDADENQMEIYDRNREAMGYKDGDSMLIGGFEQKEWFGDGDECNIDEKGLTMGKVLDGNKCDQSTEQPTNPSAAVTSTQREDSV